MAAAGVVAGITLWAGTGEASAQAPPRPDAAEIQLSLKKLRVLASVLYVAAHPDDENTRLIAYFGKGRLADAGYLAMTRGDGGQNLIGPEIGDLLGLIRSQELLAARRIDGGRQFFTRAIDFGFSKSPEETLRFWDHDQVLSDVVRVFRQFQPDVVITRFPLNDSDTHGHHTASARLAKEAFEAAGDPDRFPESAKEFGTWKPKRLYWNTAKGWYDNEADFKPEKLLKLEVGGFNPLLGESYPELAARGRSMHRSQGFGAAGQRGEFTEYLDPLDGEPAPQELFEGVDTTWARVPGGGAVGALLDRAYKEYRAEEPDRIVGILLTARERLAALPVGRWTRSKSVDLDAVIASCMGLFLEATADTPTASPGGKVKLTLEAANRSATKVRLGKVRVSGPSGGAAAETTEAIVLTANESTKKTLDLTLAADQRDSQPYWLREPGTAGMFRVDDPSLIGRAENPPALSAWFTIDAGIMTIVLQRPVVYKWTDPARGEQYRPFEIVPAIAVDFPDHVAMFPTDAARDVAVRLDATTGAADGTLRLEVPAGWQVQPASLDFHLAGRDDSTTLTFRVQAPAEAASGVMRAVATANGRNFTRGLVRVSYPHIPMQVNLPKAEARIVRVPIERKGDRIGYLQGAGDTIPAALRQIGYTVTELTEDDLVPERLAGLDAMVLGVRAYNTLDGLKARQPALFDYAKNGGTLLIQYTTTQGMKVDQVAPLPLKISRDRVSEEQAEVRFLLPQHPALVSPNKITPADFGGWVQERGLYFANEWDKGFEAVLSSNDTGEPPRDGGLLVAKYGKGYVVYTGYSFFRQIPAGVPGAYRLFANLLALGH
jgi:LmbE family N-acetylglucosaminyl deacetylase